MTDLIITDQEFLSQISTTTTPEKVKELDLINRLREANDTAWSDGCGLAAIQIGVPLRVAWFKFNKKETVLINPIIVKRKGKCKLKKEGCLSIPDEYHKVKRHYEIHYLNNGVLKKAKGIKAQIIQHEVDHMDGILINNK